MFQFRLLAAVVGLMLTGVVSTLVFAQSAAKLTTQDYHDIQQLYARYNLAIDTGDAEGWAGTFTPDGSFGNNKGHDALVQFVKDWREKRDGANRRHLNSNMVLTATSDGAKGAIYLQLLNIGVRPATIATTGIYDDAIVRTPQGWRFKSRNLHADPAPRTETK
jgi:actinorhodin biosynthesis protein ActVIA